MALEETDVVVIGAGLSGLSAAYFMRRRTHHLRVTVLEAKDRIGGRLFTKQMVSADGNVDFWDIGGEWVGRPQPHLHHMLETFDMHTIKPGYRSPDRIEGCSSWKIKLDLFIFILKLKYLKRRLKHMSLSSPECTRYDEIPFAVYKKDMLWTQEANDIVDSTCLCMFGIEPQDLSLLYFLKNVNSAGGLDVFLLPEQSSGREWRIQNGSQQLSFNLQRRIGKENILLNHPVSHIEQVNGKVKITTENGKQFICYRAILAVPPKRTLTIDFQPELPLSKENQLKNIGQAFIIKFIITFEQAFWNDLCNPSQNSFHTELVNTEAEYLGQLYDGTSARGNPALTGYFKSVYKYLEEPEERKTYILELLAGILGPEVWKYIDFAQKDWSQEPYIGGCQSKFLIPGLKKHANKDVQESFERIHFAGTETATVWCGFMNGAIQAGCRCANEVLYHLRPNQVPSLDEEIDLLFEEDVKKPKALVNAKILTFSSIGIGVLAIVIFSIKSERVPNVKPIILNLLPVYW